MVSFTASGGSVDAGNHVQQNAGESECTQEIRVPALFAVQPVSAAIPSPCDHFQGDPAFALILP